MSLFPRLNLLDEENWIQMMLDQNKIMSAFALTFSVRLDPILL